MKKFNTLVKEFNEKWTVRFSKEATKAEYIWNGIPLTLLVDSKFNQLFPGEKHMEIVEGLPGYLEKPIFIPSFFEYKEERDVIIAQLFRENPALYSLFMSRRNTSKKTEHIIGLLSVVSYYDGFEKLPDEIQGLLGESCAKAHVQLRELLKKQHEDISDMEKTYQHTQEVSRVVREWCIAFITLETEDVES